VQVLNVLAEALDDPATQSQGVRFAVRKDGTGLYCDKARAAAGPSKIAKMCAGFVGHTPATAEVRQRVRAAPDPSSPRAKGKGKGKGKRQGKRQGKRRRP
jgi:hypothetical protein